MEIWHLVMDEVALAQSKLDTLVLEGAIQGRTLDLQFEEMLFGVVL